MRYLVIEGKIAVHPGIWLLPIVLAILRLSGLIWRPEGEGWLLFLESVYPLLFPLFVFSTLEQEKSWCTLEVLLTAPKRKSGVFLTRLLYVAVPLFSTAVAATTPTKWLLLLGPGVALGVGAFLVSLLWGEEVGLGATLAWWGASFIIAVTQRELLGHPVASWFLLILVPSTFTPNGLLLRKWVHLGAGILLLLLAILVADRRRTWRLH